MAPRQRAAAAGGVARHFLLSNSAKTKARALTFFVARRLSRGVVYLCDTESLTLNDG
jgi:hypothetical protein